MTPSKPVRQADEPAEPCQRHFFELSGRGRGSPEHGLLVERGAEKVGQDAGRASGDGEVPEEAGMIPVRQAWNQHMLEISHDGFERLGFLWRGWREGAWRIAPGATCDRTGYFSGCSRYSAIHSTSACPCRRKSAGSTAGYFSTVTVTGERIPRRDFVAGLECGFARVARHDGCRSGAATRGCTDRGALRAAGYRTENGADDRAAADACGARLSARFTDSA